MVIGLFGCYSLLWVLSSWLGGLVIIISELCYCLLDVWFALCVLGFCCLLLGM